MEKILKQGNILLGNHLNFFVAQSGGNYISMCELTKNVGSFRI